MALTRDEEQFVKDFYSVFERKNQLIEAYKLLAIKLEDANERLIKDKMHPLPDEIEAIRKECEADTAAILALTAETNELNSRLNPAIRGVA